ncbi:MAG: lamin tail domain-containing protein [bacterium]
MSKIWFLAVALFVFGCGTDSPNNKAASCVADTDCAAGSYCGLDKVCTFDCNAELACANGTTCSASGRCIASNAACEVDDDCDSPPAGLSCDGDVLVGASPSGTCDLSGAAPVCVYPELRTPCENGCTASGCATDSCSGKVCDAAPAPRCGADGITRILYGANGVCEGAGDCVYPETTESCALGCVNGQCLQGACESITCDTPPASKCDRSVAMSYSPMGTCDDSTGSPVCDYTLNFQHCGYVKGVCDNATCINGITQTGGVVIVEYMANPAGGAAEGNEWFEITNTSGAAIDLTGWKILSGGTSSDQEHLIADNMLTPVPAFAPGQTLLFAATATATGVAQPDYVYSDISLANSTDWLALVDPNGAFVDYVFYETGAVLDGHSRKLNPSVAATALDNDQFGNWCPSLSDPYTSGPQNFGTPGAANTACAADPCAATTCVKPDNFCTNLSTAVQFLGDTATCEATRFNNPFCNFQATNLACQPTELCALGTCETVPGNLPAAGDVIITEIMADPSKVSDTNGEWFELYNTTSNPLSLFSVVFQDNETGGGADAYVITDIAATIPANGYVVFARERDMALNGGISGAYYFTGRHLKNTSDPLTYSLAIALRDGTIIDSAYFATATRGKSAQLDPDQLNAAANDDGANWCVATQTYGDGDFGTPGAPNDQCP